eukprot:TRINITY_DN6683_c0_g1_i4.p1 TRINITY_DN6683_c0_g1~~TRINITY_DN6683_c0_g1_i4.p1  ORF type:complete len:640 (-),score=138.81 TRINITY_DN6683_c0_g1_i4:103-2022(-)
MKIEFLLLCIFLFWAGLAKQKWKVSKAMENNLEAKKEIFKEQGKLNAEYNEYSEAKLKMKNIKTKSFNDLQQIFYPDSKQCRSNLSRNLSSLALQENKGECLDYEPRWDLVGAGHPWDLVILHHFPVERRVKDAASLLTNTHVLIIHDTDNPALTTSRFPLPPDFRKSGKSKWNGHPCFTDVSDITKTSATNKFEISFSLSTTLEKKIFTTIIQGDLDKDGKVFESIIAKFKEHADDINAGYNHYNEDNLYKGTHIRLVLAAAMMTFGDILELGTDELSTKLLHDILDQDDDTSKRLLVSAESQLKNLEKHKSEFHQLLHVPDCKAGDEEYFDAVQELCGELCNLDKEVTKQEDEFLGSVRSKVVCENLFQNNLLNKYNAGPPPQWHQVSDKYKQIITHNGRVPAELFYFDDSELGSDQREPRVVDVQWWIDQWENGTHITSEGTSELIDEAAAIIDVSNKNILVIGTVEPWLEAVLFSRGAKKVVTLEYGNYVSHFPNHEFIKPKEFSERYLAGSLDKFDAVFTHSSLEHSGLGRYGDSLNPWGDLISIAQAWCASTPEAKLAIAVPTAVNGEDAILFNGAKIYGPRLYPFLTTNWKFTWPLEDEKRIHPRAGFINTDWMYQPLFIFDKIEMNKHDQE